MVSPQLSRGVAAPSLREDRERGHMKLLAQCEKLFSASCSKQGVIHTSMGQYSAPTQSRKDRPEWANRLARSRQRAGSAGSLGREALPGAAGGGLRQLS